MKQYKIIKLFVSGLLKGLIITEQTTVNFKLNKTYKSISGSNYKIIYKEVLN